jgi:hypothetical protein
VTLLVPRETILKVQFQTDLLDHVGCGRLSNAVEIEQMGTDLFGESFKRSSFSLQLQSVKSLKMCGSHDVASSISLL